MAASVLESDVTSEIHLLKLQLEKLRLVERNQWTQLRDARHIIKEQKKQLAQMQRELTFYKDPDGIYNVS